MDKKIMQIKEIIFCKNYLGLDVFNDMEKEILKDLYFIDKEEDEEKLSINEIFIKYGINEDYLKELTRTFDNINYEIEETKKKSKTLVKQQY